MCCLARAEAEGPGAIIDRDSYTEIHLAGRRFTTVKRGNANGAQTRTFRIRVDLAKLRRHLSREEKRPVTEAEARKLLVDAAFTPEDDSWIVSEQNLGLLDPSEVVSIEPIDDRKKNLPGVP